MTRSVQEEPTKGPEGSLSRRRFLRGLGLAAGATAAAGIIPLTEITKPRTSPASPDAMPDMAPSSAKHQWAFVIDLRRCDGCKKCTDACQKTHYLPKDQEWIKVYELIDQDGNKSFFPRLCMQCENAPCLKVCPVAATYKNEDGVILIDQTRCIGCRLCMAACPYEARSFNYKDPIKPTQPLMNQMPEYPVPQVKGTVGKCVFCVHYVDQGKLPACVEACGMDALYIAELNSDVMTNASGETYQLSKYLRENDAYRYKEELNTSPRVWYIPGHGQDLSF